MSRNRKPKTDKPTKPLVEISEEEQWRLINESGILKQASADPNGSIQFEPVASSVVEEAIAEDTPLAEEVFSAITLVIPFSCLLLMFEILIHHQYGKQPTKRDLVNRMVPSVPILSIFIFYTSRYKYTRMMQGLLFLLSLAVGTRMVWSVNRANWIINMQQCPPLATIWVYTIVQLDLGPAVLGLGLVVGFMRWKGLKLAF